MIVTMARPRRGSGPTGPGAVPPTGFAGVGPRDRFGGLVVLAAVGVFVAAYLLAVTGPGTAYVWHQNMISDLGDRSCHVRGGRWICSPGHVLFNVGLVATGGLLAVAGGLLRAWGRVLAGSVLLMGVGLVLAGLFPATDHAALHLAGVVLALVTPGAGLLWSAARPETTWLRSGRTARGLLGAVALVLAAESRLPDPVVPRGAGELGMVACLLAALLVEVVRLWLHRRDGPGRAVPTSRSAGGTAATGSASRTAAPRSAASARR